MITIALLDDEITFLARSKAILSTALLDNRTCDYEYNILTYQSSNELIKLSESTFIDVLVLDIHMPEPNGLSVAEHFHSESPDTKIIFLSNYEQYVFYSLRFAPFRFVRKSKIETELSEAVISAVTVIAGADAVLDISDRDNIQKVPLSKILYIEKAKGMNYLEIVCVSEKLNYRQNISTIEKQLTGYNFIKINQSFIVNMKYIHRIQKDNVILRNGIVLKIARRSVDQIKDRYFKYIVDNSIN